MALRMVALNRIADGRWFARKVIPEDVREAYQRLYGVRREAHLKLPADTPRHESKVRLGEWEAEVETRIATLRAQRNGEGQPLTRVNAIALAGRWYSWFVAQYENDPGPAKVWRELSDIFVWEVIRSEAPESFEEDPRSDPHWDWAKEPEVREAVRPRVAEQARVATFLASEGIALNATAYALFVDAVSDNLLLAFSVLEKRANGDYCQSACKFDPSYCRICECYPDGAVAAVDAMSTDWPR
ncbi:hypothetical protein, partial [Bradyrhizobium liaoningense]|uniref:hypothetical protein n=1 Tax=Bradyrhizobium liaoningense TaxID=43992 RepID=UPI001BA5129B